jgi:hypothetical protein
VSRKTVAIIDQKFVVLEFADLKWIVWTTNVVTSVESLPRLDILFAVLEQSVHVNVASILGHS